MAVATLWVRSCGRRGDEAAQLESTPDRTRVLAELPPPTERATSSLYGRGCARLGVNLGTVGLAAALAASECPARPSPGVKTIIHHPESDMQAERYIPQEGRPETCAWSS